MKQGMTFVKGWMSKILIQISNALETRKWIREHIPKRALVLDIGSGDMPFARSDVLCDKFLFDDTERGGAMHVDRPCVVGDIEALPFKRKSFDFIVCHHLLEHVSRPSVAIEELMRVGKAGSIRVPSQLAEKLFSPVYHYWMICLEDGELVFRRKKSPIWDAEIKKFMKEKAFSDGLYPRNYKKFRSDLEIRIVWKDEIRYRVEGENVENDEIAFRKSELKNRDEYSDEVSLVLDGSASNGSQPNFKKGIRNQLYRLYRSFLPSSKFNLSDLLACPLCRNDLDETIKGSEMTCRSCDAIFPIRENVPELIRERAKFGVSGDDGNRNKGAVADES